jgi:hypothetical protein
VGVGVGVCVCGWVGGWVGVRARARVCVCRCVFLCGGLLARGAKHASTKMVPGRANIRLKHCPPCAVSCVLKSQCPGTFTI